MKSKEKKQLHSKTKGELRDAMKKAVEELSSMQMVHAQGKLKNTTSLARKKAELAIIKTYMQEKEIHHENA